MYRSLYAGVWDIISARLKDGHSPVFWYVLTDMQHRSKCDCELNVLLHTYAPYNISQYTQRSVTYAVYWATYWLTIDRCIYSLVLGGDPWFASIQLTIEHCPYMMRAWYPSAIWWCSRFTWKRPQWTWGRKRERARRQGHLRRGDIEGPARPQCVWLLAKISPRRASNSPCEGRTRSGAGQQYNLLWPI